MLGRGGLGGRLGSNAEDSWLRDGEWKGWLWEA